MSAIKTKKILILGAGFAGLRVAQNLTKNLPKNIKAEITLVDKGEAHVYTPDLYEIANHFNDEITDECLTTLKECVATHIDHLIDTKKVKFIQDEVSKIEPEPKRVHLKKHGELAYDHLVVALGSKQNFYSIPGLKQFSYPVKTIKDALVINCHLDTFFHFLWKKGMKDKVMISIGGGGATGVEFAAEMIRYLDKLSEKYNYPRNKIHIRIIQGGSELVGQGQRVSDYTKVRLEEKGIEVLLNHLITKVEPHRITVKHNNDEKHLYSDILIWTGGVMVNPVVSEYVGTKEKHGAIAVNTHMQSVEHPSIWAAGDNAYFEDPKTKKSAPMLAQTAWEQGEVVAKNIVNTLVGKRLSSYQIHTAPLIMPVAGKWGIVKYGNFVYRGFFGWIIRRLTDLLYATKIMPFFKALKKWRHDNKIFIKHD